MANRDAFRSFLLGFLHHAEVLEPAELRDDLVQWLAEVAVATRPPWAAAHLGRRLNAMRLEGVSGDASAERLQRLLAMVPWIAAQDGPRIDEVCSRFGITPAQLAADLEVIWLVGLPPYTPDALVDVVQEGDRVWIHYAEVFGSAHRAHPGPGRRAAHRRARACWPCRGRGRRGPGLRRGQAGPRARHRRRPGPRHPPRRRRAGGRGRAPTGRSTTDAACASTTTPTGATSGRCATSTRTCSRRRRAASTSSATVIWPVASGASGSIASPRWTCWTCVRPADRSAPHGGRSRLTTPTPESSWSWLPRAAWVQEVYPVERVESLPDGAIQVTLAVVGRSVARAAPHRPRARPPAWWTVRPSWPRVPAAPPPASSTGTVDSSMTQPPEPPPRLRARPAGPRSTRPPGAPRPRPPGSPVVAGPPSAATATATDEMGGEPRRSPHRRPSARASGAKARHKRTGSAPPWSGWR